MALQKHVVTIPLSQGLDNKTDEFQVAAGKSLELENARFYKAGKLQKKFGFTPLVSTTETGTLLDTTIKAIVSDDSMLNVLTDDGVYGLSSGANKWELLSEMKDMVKLKTEFLSKSSYNHFNPDMDYHADLNMIASVFREVEENNGLTANAKEFVTIVLEDVETGLRKIRKLDVINTASYQKAQQKISLTSSGGLPVVTLFYDAPGNLIKHHVLDENLDDLIAANTIESLSGTNFLKYKMDVCRDGSNTFLAYMYETTLKLKKYDLAGAVVTSSTLTTTNRLGSDPGSDNGQGFSICQTTSNVHIFFVSNLIVPAYEATIVGLGVDKSLALAITETTSSSNWSNTRDISIAANGSAIAIAVSEISGTTDKECKVRKIEITWASAYIFDEPDFFDAVFRAVIISRPFFIDDISYVVCKCPETDQNTGLVYNMVTRKFVAMFSPFGLSSDRLTSQVFSSYTTGTCNAVASGPICYSMIEKAYGVNTNSVLTYDFNASIAVSKITSDFSNTITAGMKTKIGDTNYYTNGSTFSLDNRGCFEAGFFLRPLITAIVSNTSGVTTPGVASKTFNYVAVYNFFNGKGELERSIPSPAFNIATSATTTYVDISVKNLLGTYKNKYRADFSEIHACQIVLYRTKDNGTAFYRVTGKAANPLSDIVQLYDASADAAIEDNEILYSTGNVLESDPAPNAKFSTAGGNRLFLGGLEEDDEIAFSKKQLFGEAVSFSDAFRIRISSGTRSDRSKLSALGYLDGKLIIFRENSIYYIAGDGPLETGAQDTFTEPEVISSDTGCVEPRSVINVPTGLLFKSKKGIYLLDRSLQVSYVGAGVEDFNTEGIVSAVVSDKYNEARFNTDAGNGLVYNYHFNQWSVFKSQSIIDSDIWAGTPVQVSGGVITQENEASFLDSGVAFAMKVKTPWLKINGLQDFGRIWSATILGTYKSTHDLNVKVYYDYDESYFEEFNISPESTDSQYQYRIHLRKQKCESLQFVIRDTNQTGESMELSALTLEIGLKKGSMKLSAARKY